MKSLSSIHLPALLSILLILLPSMPGFGATAWMGNTAPKVTRQCAVATEHKAKSKKIGFLQKIRLFVDSKKAMRKWPFEQNEKASTLAKSALFLFLGAIALSVLLSVLGISSALLSSIISLAWLASIVISFIVLFGDENRRSKAIAKTILIVTAIFVFFTFFLLFLVLAAFTA